MAVKNKLSVSVDTRIIIVILLLIIAVMMVLWQPWEERFSAASRTIEVEGQYTLEAEPDEYVFYPMYQERGTDRTEIQQRLNAKVTAITDELKKLGVPENKIVLASNTFDTFYREGDGEVTNNSMTITVNNKELAQKVQDYLATTSPQGQTTPSLTFSETKRKEMESKAREEAIKDAKSKAESTAAQLDAKIGKLISVGDVQDGILPFDAGQMRGSAGAADISTSLETSKLPVTPGTLKVPYQVIVKYQIK